MQAMSETRQLIRDLGALLEIPDLELDETHACQLSFDEILLCLEVDESLGRILVYAPVADLPAAGREELLLMMLAGNLFWGETGGATLACSRTAEKAVLQESISLERLTLQALADRLEAFLAKCESWAAKLANPALSETRPGGGRLLQIQTFV